MAPPPAVGSRFERKQPNPEACLDNCSFVPVHGHVKDGQASETHALALGSVVALFSTVEMVLRPVAAETLVRVVGTQTFCLFLFCFSSSFVQTETRNIIFFWYFIY